MNAYEGWLDAIKQIEHLVKRIAELEKELEKARAAKTHCAEKFWQKTPEQMVDEWMAEDKKRAKPCHSKPSSL